MAIPGVILCGQDMRMVTPDFYIITMINQSFRMFVKLVSARSILIQIKGACHISNTYILKESGTSLIISFLVSFYDNSCQTLPCCCCVSCKIMKTVKRKRITSPSCQSSTYIMYVTDCYLFSYSFPFHQRRREISSLTTPSQKKGNEQLKKQYYSFNRQTSGFGE